MSDPANLQAALSHVLWIGGSPCAGKSSICLALARMHVFPDYRLDAMQRDHARRRIANGDREFAAFLAKNMDQRWLQPTVEELAQQAIQSWSKLSPLTIEDLMLLPREPLLLAEGNFFPEALIPYLSSPHQAIWLIPTDEFCAQVRKKRFADQEIRRQRAGVQHGLSSSDEFVRKLIARDCLLAQYVKQQAQDLRVPFYEVDGKRSLDEMIALVEQHFTPHIAERFKHMGSL
ncbi:hypothetical protein EPA93_38545 [Ktedonosporobacter rubrisoli]|uniref:Uncharacterized protein n=1 Tax=Ktedonosporobacter rubrisoli TaxID=2509675 RepID=A0A4P6K255_KTERU|nr:hypothetical protein [Ktedonosporobacter rubrisoli]QBD81556.1 hypothetical protein EPA93_38545 [Ktedonosporobacter rubrisoli]